MRFARKTDHQPLFAVATPIHMIAPVSAGNADRRMGGNSIQTIPANAAGSAGNDDERVEQRLEVHDDQHVHEHDGAEQAINRPLNEAFIVWACRHTNMRRPRCSTILDRPAITLVGIDLPRRQSAMSVTLPARVRARQAR